VIMKGILRPAFLHICMWTILLGLVYPALMTGIGQLIFPSASNGSMVNVGGKPLGSTLIGQPMSAKEYFWSRPSSTTPFAYNAQASSGSNLGPSNPALKEAVIAQVNKLHNADPNQTEPIPIDLVTSSASGLDPHISPEAAFYQVNRVAKARNLEKQAVRNLVEHHIEDHVFGFLGEPKVNVLLLNLALDQLVRKDSN
jgi:potassium-transporting ATPase KdpC subunit